MATNHYRPFRLLNSILMHPLPLHSPSALKPAQRAFDYFVHVINWELCWEILSPNIQIRIHKHRTDETQTTRHSSWLNYKLLLFDPSSYEDVKNYKTIEKTLSINLYYFLRIISFQFDTRHFAFSQLYQAVEEYVFQWCLKEMFVYKMISTFARYFPSGFEIENNHMGALTWRQRWCGYSSILNSTIVAIKRGQLQPTHNCRIDN